MNDDDEHERAVHGISERAVRNLRRARRWHAILNAWQGGLGAFLVLDTLLRPGAPWMNLIVMLTGAMLLAVAIRDVR